MFDIAWSELLLIAVIALIFIGPKELPQVLHNLGRAATKMRRSAEELRRHFEDSMREAGYEELHKNIQDLRSLNPGNQLKESIGRAINQEYAPKPSPAIQHVEAAMQSQTGALSPVPEASAFAAAAAAGGEAAPQDNTGSEHRTAPVQGAKDTAAERSKEPAAPVA